MSAHEIQVYEFHRKLYSRSMYLLPVLCSFTCILQVLCTPTVVPIKTFDATKDARTTCDIGRSEDDVNRQKIIRMLCHRTIDERIKVKEEFEKIKDDKYCSKKDIVDYIFHIESDNESYSLDYESLLQDAFKSEHQMYLDDLAKNFQHIVVEASTIIEIFLSIPPNGKKKFKEDYDKMGYRFTFNEGLKELKDDLNNVVTELSKRERQEEKEVNQEQAQKDADSLNAERKKWKNDRGDLDRILMETPIKQLNATLFEFKKRHGKPLEQLIDEKMKNEDAKRQAYRELIYYGYNPADYYAGRLDFNFNQEGLKHIRNVNRIIMIHSQTDLVEIAAAFQAKTQRSLIDVIKEKTDLDREALLCCLAGEKGFEET